MPTFPLYNEKLLAEDFKFISWCPTADLVLLISPSNNLLLYRGGIDLLWFLENKIKSDINIVTWRPNGKEFVVGCENGVVYKVDITYHSPHVTEYLVNNKDISPITAFSWINHEFKKKQMQHEGFDPDAFDIKKSLPTLNEESPVEPLSRIPRPKQSKSILPPKPLQNTETQSLLFIGNKRGEIHIYLNGIYPIGSIKIENSNETTSIINTTVAENISSLQILAKPESSSEEYIIYFLNTRILELRKEEIFSISEIQTELNYLIQYTTSTINVLKQHHDSYSRSTRNVVTETTNYIEKYESLATAPEVELLGILLTGNMTEPTNDLFVDYLSSQRIKQWETNANHGYKNSQTVLCLYVLPACERIQLALSKLLGYSLWKQRYGDFLEVEAVKRCIESIQALIVGLNEFNKSLISVMKRFSAFIAWLTIVSQRVYESTSDDVEAPPILCDDPVLVEEYINKDFVKDSLAEYFSSSEYEEAPSRNLLDALGQFTRICNEMLEKPSKTISTKIQVSSKMAFQLKGVTLDQQPRDRIVSITTKPESDPAVETSKTNKSESIIYAFMKSDLSLKRKRESLYKSLMLLLRKTFDNEPLQYAQFAVEGDITDYEFFDQKELGLSVQIDQVTSKLQTISIENVEFQDFTSDELISSEISPSREQKLNNMIGVKIGCNGLPRRRLFGLVASNGQLKVHFMDDEGEDEDMDDDEDEEQEEQEGEEESRIKRIKV